MQGMLNIELMRRIVSVTLLYVITYREIEDGEKKMLTSNVS